MYTTNDYMAHGCKWTTRERRRKKTNKDNAISNIIGPYNRAAKTEKGNGAHTYRKYTKNAK